MRARCQGRRRGRAEVTAITRAYAEAGAAGSWRPQPIVRASRSSRTIHTGKLTPLTGLLPERCIYVSSLSKSVAPALRVGFVRAPRHLVGRIADFIYATTVMVAAPTAEVASAWIADGTADRIVKWKRAEIRQGAHSRDAIFGRCAE
jgi:DNA-binding transcriptional MocR family regulator